VPSPLGSRPQQNNTYRRKTPLKAVFNTDGTDSAVSEVTAKTMNLAGTKLWVDRVDPANGASYIDGLQFVMVQIDPDGCFQTLERFRVYGGIPFTSVRYYIPTTINGNAVNTGGTLTINYATDHPDDALKFW
jgi:hypothetical protein